MIIPISARAHLLPDGDVLPCVVSHEDDCTTVRVENPGERTCRAVLEFSCFVEAERVALPLSMNGLFKHPALADVSADEQWTPGEHPVGELVAHYLEPQGSHPDEVITRAPLLIPLIEWLPGRVAWFASPERPWRFACERTEDGRWRWSLQTIESLAPGRTWTERCWLVTNQDAWRAFHRLAHADTTPVPSWLRGVKTHYFDFLSAGADGRRGNGYDESLPHFPEFHVGLGTQHGYYPYWGDYVQPGRQHWRAMLADANGPAEMSIARVRQRIAATRQAGARAGIYIHLVGFDGASPLDATLRDAARVDVEDQSAEFAWRGPDVVGPVRFMSMNAPAWRNHLLQQSAWIMEMLDPDAIIVDETFAAVGYDHHPDRRGPTSLATIQWMKDMRALVHSYGDDKAILTSDCGLGSLVLWADGEAGDHAYDHLLGHPCYRRQPVPYLAALNDKPWLPCAWQAWKFWDAQVDLARSAGSAIGVSDGWMEFTGLARMPAAQRQRMLVDLG